MRNKTRAAERGRRVWAVPALLALLAGLTVWLQQPVPNSHRHSDALTASAAVSASPASANASSVPQTSPTDASQTVIPAAEEAGAANSAGARPLAQIEAQWCSHAAQAHLQSLVSIDQSRPRSVNGEIDQQAMQAWATAKANLPGSQAIAEVRARLTQAWLAALRAQNSPRSQAIANLLMLIGQAGTSEDRLKHLAATRAQVLQLSDPLLVELLADLEFSCADVSGQCAPVALKRWSEIEPQNLYAWLPFRSDAITISEAQWQGISKARYARSYRSDLLTKLLPLLDRSTSSLEREQGLVLIERMSESAGRDSATFMLKVSCERLPSNSPKHGICLHAAELLWNDPQPSMSDRMRAIGLARSSNLQAPSAWVDRQAQLNALVADVHRTRTEILLGLRLRVPGCDGHDTRRQWLQALVDGGELKALELVRTSPGARGARAGP